MPATRVVVSILALGLLSAAPLAQSALKPIPFSDTRLSNGLRVIISEDHYAPVYAIAVSYAVSVASVTTHAPRSYSCCRFWCRTWC